MREIKFRAKSVNGGEWVYGNFIHSKRFAGCSNEFRIHDQETGLETDIVIDTLGQFTGLKDENGIDVYEGDIILYDNDIFPALVVFNNGSFQTECPFTKDLGDLVKNKIQIIGNIHQNPDLLK